MPRLVGRTPHGKTVGTEVSIALTTPRPTEGRDKSIHDILILAKVLAYPNELGEGQGGHVDVNMKAHTLVDHKVHVFTEGSEDQIEAVETYATL
jgi:hypothetical protein